MEDIIFSVPWLDNDKGEYWWVLSNYWAYADGSYTRDSCGDGDHDPVDLEDLPGSEEVSAAWLAYHRDCIKTGCDPLGEYLILEHKRTVQRWQFVIVKSIAGLVVQRVRRAGKTYRTWELPGSIRDYLLMKSDGTSSNTEATEADLKAEGLKLGRWETVRLEKQDARKGTAIKRDIRRAARRALKHNTL